jgi:uncharacterized membrane protein YgcG
MVDPLRRASRWVWRRTVRSELGEGVISAAIAVLIMAFLGVAMWFGFRQTLGNTQTNVNNQVTRIGTDNGTSSGGSGGGGVGGSSGGASGSSGGTSGGTSSGAGS